MARTFRIAIAIDALLTAMAAADQAIAQKPGGVLKLSHFDSPASVSMLEESTVFAEGPMMGVFKHPSARSSNG
jgi:peptide/nickel transport system substrate-binding protein